MRLFGVLFFLFGITAQAGSLEMEYIQGPQSTSYDFTGNGDFNPAVEKATAPVFSWDLAYNQDQSAAADPTTGVIITDLTQSGTIGLSVETSSHFLGGIDLNFSTTPAEQLNSAGPVLTVGYKKEFGAPDANFRPSLRGTVGFGTTTNSQSFTTQTRRSGSKAPRPVGGNNIIGQTSNVFEIDYGATSWLMVKTTYTRYGYNRDVNQFLQYIDSPVLASVSGGISNALSGFYLYTLKVETDFTFSKIWILEFSHSTSQLATDMSFSNENDITLDANLTDTWEVGAGVEWITLTAAGATSITNSVFKLDYNF